MILVLKSASRRSCREARKNSEKIPVVAEDRTDDLIDFPVNLAPARVDHGNSGEADFDRSVRHREEPFVFRGIKFLFCMENSEFVLVRGTAVRTEHHAVSAFIAHSVHMQDLRHFDSGDMDRDICPVRTDLHTAFADRGAAEAAGEFLSRVVISVKDTLLFEAGIGIIPCAFRNKRSILSDNGVRGFSGIRNTFHNSGRPAVGISDDIYSG